MSAPRKRHIGSRIDGPASFGRSFAVADLAGETPRHFQTVSLNGPDAQIYSWGELLTRFERIVERQRHDRAYFYRHGNTKYNQRNLISGQHDTVLSELGKQQAVELRHALPDQIDLIVCSALTRAVQTMRLSVPKHVLGHATAILDPRLNEVNLGVLQGRRKTHLSQFAEGDLDFAPENGESYRNAANRVLSVIVDIFDLLAECGDSPRTAVIFCHAGVLRIVSTIVRTGGIRDVFKFDAANGECLTVPAERVRLPNYWNGPKHAGSAE